MNVSNRVKLFFLWVVVSSVHSWSFVHILEVADRKFSETFSVLYEVSPMLTVVSLFVFWGLIIVLTFGEFKKEGGMKHEKLG